MFPGRVVSISSARPSTWNRNDRELGRIRLDSVTVRRGLGGRGKRPPGRRRAARPPRSTRSSSSRRPYQIFDATNPTKRHHAMARQRRTHHDRLSATWAALPASRMASPRSTRQVGPCRNENR
jgi:hypothetical protein